MVILCPMKAYPDPEGLGIKFCLLKGRNTDDMRMTAVGGGAALNTLLEFPKKCTYYNPIYQAGELSQDHKKDRTTQRHWKENEVLRVLKNVT